MQICCPKSFGLYMQPPYIMTHNVEFCFFFNPYVFCCGIRTVVRFKGSGHWQFFRCIHESAKSKSFVMFVCPSIHQHRTTWLPLHRFWSIFWKYVKKIQLSLKSDKNNGYVTTNIHFRSYLAHFFLEWEMLETEFVDKIRRHSLHTLTFWKLYSLWDNVEKYCRGMRATKDNMAHAHCMLDA